MGLQNGRNEEDTVMSMEKGTVIFSCTYVDNSEKQEAVQYAKDYIVANSYTQEQVRIADRGDIVVVVLR